MMIKDTFRNLPVLLHTVICVTTSSTSVWPGFLHQKGKIDYEKVIEHLTITWRLAGGFERVQRDNQMEVLK